MEVQLHEFLTLACEWSAALPRRVIPAKIKVWVNHKDAWMQGYKEQPYFPHRETNPNPRVISPQVSYHTDKGISVLMMIMIIPMIKY
jgi:hypothetical protein